jgi:hypothetical protein
VSGILYLPQPILFQASLNGQVDIRVFIKRWLVVKMTVTIAPLAASKLKKHLLLYVIKPK